MVANFDYCNLNKKKIKISSDYYFFVNIDYFLVFVVFIEMGNLNDQL